ncbi:MAG: hypothetical protein KKB51_02880, partial [Candidatus Riflebacteria bacterium]|nr:hypothetical protein [Candidatus Riflebacteria bacterium]
KTPSQTLSRVIQELRNSGFIRFEEKGIYELIFLQNIDLEKTDITSQEFNDNQVDGLIQENKLLIPDFIVSIIYFSQTVGCKSTHFWALS